MFKQDSIYISPYFDGIFLCEDVLGIGKLVLFSKITKEQYKRTSIQYFINTFKQGDLKEVILSINNYEEVGRLNHNFIIDADRQSIRKIK